jgi:DNA-binding transcriptional MerR regulator
MRTYRIGVAAERAGLSEELIRAWERRYRVVTPQRTAGGYRVYTDEDIALLRRVRHLTEEGVAIGEAADMVPELRREIATGDVGDADNTQVSRWRERILAAAAELDQEAVDRVLDAALAVLTPLRMYQELIINVERDIGERAVQGTPGLAQERVVTQIVRARLLGLLRTAPGGSRRHVVCACLPDEEHDLGLLGAALRFRHAGYRVTFLGARAPVDHLLHVVKVLRPQIVALTAVNDPGAAELRKTLYAITRDIPSPTRVIIGGAAAERHKPTCLKLGVTVITDDQDWSKILK